jgi:hypothetical protein
MAAARGGWRTRRWRWAARGGGACGTCVVLSSPGPPLYIGGRGASLPPPQGTMGGGQGERRAAATRVGVAKPAPQNPNPGRPGPGA